MTLNMIHSISEHRLVTTDTRIGSIANLFKLRLAEGANLARYLFPIITSVLYMLFPTLLIEIRDDWIIIYIR